MEKRKNLFFSYGDMVFLLVIAFFSFEARSFRIARPQKPVLCEEFEINLIKNYSQNNEVSGEERALGRSLKYLYINLAQVNFSELFSKNSTYYSSYRYVSLRQYSSFFSLITPCALYIFLLIIGANKYVSKCCSIILAFNQTVTCESRYFSSLGIYQFSFILTLIFLFKFTSYQRNSLSFYIAALIGGISMLLSLSSHSKSIILFSFYATFYYVYNNHAERLKDQMINFGVFMLPAVVSEILFSKIERLFIKENVADLRHTKMSPFYYEATDIPTVVVIVTAFILCFYYFIEMKKNLCASFMPFLFILFTSTNVKSLSGHTRLFAETSISVITSLIIFSVLTTNATMLRIKYLSCAVTIFVIISIAMFIYNAPHVYNYDRNHPELTLY